MIEIASLPARREAGQQVGVTTATGLVPKDVRLVGLPRPRPRDRHLHRRWRRGRRTKQRSRLASGGVVVCSIRHVQGTPAAPTAQTWGRLGQRWGGRRRRLLLRRAAGQSLACIRHRRRGRWRHLAICAPRRRHVRSGGGGGSGSLLGGHIEHLRTLRRFGRSHRPTATRRTMMLIRALVGARIKGSAPRSSCGLARRGGRASRCLGGFGELAEEVRGRVGGRRLLHARCGAAWHRMHRVQCGAASAIHARRRHVDGCKGVSATSKEPLSVHGVRRDGKLSPLLPHMPCNVVQRCGLKAGRQRFEALRVAERGVWACCFERSMKPGIHAQGIHCRIECCGEAPWSVQGAESVVEGAKSEFGVCER